MYFPYLRGRQNELLCLRELVEKNLLSNYIIPIIEPVRYSSTLFLTIKRFIEADKNLIIIQNPNVGNYNSDFVKMQDKIKKLDDETKKNQMQKDMESNQNLLDDPHVIHAYICDGNIVTQCLNGKINKENIVLINTDFSNFNSYEEHGDDLASKFTIIPKDEDFHDIVEGNVIVLEDSFKKANRNQDYMNHIDELFSRAHLSFKKHGYKGFSDYSIVGSTFEEGGFAPIAVAIHIVYFDEKKNLRIHHFVSDTNENDYDTPRKFGEAMQKLKDWQYSKPNLMTQSLSCLLKYFEDGKFPGLGVVKKYCIMHHLELIGNYLGKEK